MALGPACQDVFKEVLSSSGGEDFGLTSPPSAKGQAEGFCNSRQVGGS